MLSVLIWMEALHVTVNQGLPEMELFVLVRSNVFFLYSSNTHNFYLKILMNAFLKKIIVITMHSV